MKLGRIRGCITVGTVVLMTCLLCQSEDKRKIIIDQDAAGPAGTDQQSMLLLIQSPQTEVLGITVVTGDAWLTEEVAHTLRMLEIIGRTDIPVLRGAEYPLVRTKEETEHMEQRYGAFAWLGAWTPRFYHAPRELGEMPEGKPTAKAADEDAAHFLIRMVRKYPHEVTIYEGGPMTNLALAISIDPKFPELAEELVFMGGSLGPQTANAEFVNNPRHEFNFWFDPEAAYVVLRAPWRKIICTTTDISVKTSLTRAMVEQIDKAGTPLAHYVAQFYQSFPGADIMWDELAAAAWIDPSIITKCETRYMSVDLDHGAGYGNTLTWSEATRPGKDKSANTVRSVEIQTELDKEKFYSMFTRLMTAATPAR